MATILALDTATTACSVALWRDGTIRARHFEPMARGQAEALMPMVVAVLGEAGWGFHDLDLVAVTTGPGAFTGLRIGLAAARALALAQGLPCLGVNTLDAVAHGVPAAERAAGSLLVVLETKRADLYAQVFDARARDAAPAPLGPPRAVLPGAIAALLPDGPVVVAGDGAGRAIQALEEAGRAPLPSTAAGVPDAAHVAALAAARWRPGTALDPPQPLYLRPPDAVRPRAGGRLRP